MGPGDCPPHLVISSLLPYYNQNQCCQLSAGLDLAEMVLLTSQLDRSHSLPWARPPLKSWRGPRVGGCRSLLFLPLFLFRLLSVLHAVHSHVLFFPSPLNSAGRSGKSFHSLQRKITASCRSWRGPNTLGPVPVISNVGGYASHGSHRAVAPIAPTLPTVQWLLGLLLVCS